MKQAISVIATALMDGRLKFETSEAQAADILDRLNAAGFQIMEPSDKVFNSTDPVVIEDARAAMQSFIQKPSWVQGEHLPDGRPTRKEVAWLSYEMADAMKKEREKRQ
jgi:hypothetical protein